MYDISFQQTFMHYFIVRRIILFVLFALIFNFTFILTAVSAPGNNDVDADPVCQTHLNTAKVFYTFLFLPYRCVRTLKRNAIWKFVSMYVWIMNLLCATTSQCHSHRHRYHNTPKIAFRKHLFIDILYMQYFLNDVVSMSVHTSFCNICCIKIIINCALFYIRTAESSR